MRVVCHTLPLLPRVHGEWCAPAITCHAPGVASITLRVVTLATRDQRARAHFTEQTLLLLLWHTVIALVRCDGQHSLCCAVGYNLQQKHEPEQAHGTRSRVRPAVGPWQRHHIKRGTRAGVCLRFVCEK